MIIIEDIEIADIIKYFDSCCRLIGDSIAKRENILVHCRSGIIE
jgi:protein-tyrosine phosphatase